MRITAVILLAIAYPVIGGPMYTSEEIKDDLSLIYYGNSWNDNVSIPVSDVLTLLDQPGFSVDKKTMFYVPGFLQHVDNFRTQDIVETYLNLTNYNIIQLNYTKFSVTKYKIEYVISIGVSSEVGKHFANAINSLQSMGLDAKNIEIIGHSLGSLVAGEIASLITPKVALVVALDAPGPLNFDSSFKAGVADYTIQIITNSILWGTYKHLADVCYLPNGGRKQPGCPGEHGNYISCSHERSIYIWINMLLHPDLFYGIECSDGTDNCDPQQITRVGPKIKLYGDYYFKTKGRAPYGMGLTGVYDYV